MLWLIRALRALNLVPIQRVLTKTQKCVTIIMMGSENISNSDKYQEIEFIACGPWLEFSLTKRILLTIRYWLPWVLRATWKSKEIWTKYVFWKIFKSRPLLWGDVVGAPDKEDFDYVADPNLYFFIALAGKGHWLWYESREQLENKENIEYSVDWEGKGTGWYPFW